MKLCILGATGNSGRRLVDMALADGHQATAVVRDAARLKDKDRANLQVRAVSFDDHRALVDAMRGADVVVNAAGNANDGPAYAPMVKKIIDAAAEALGAGGRFWFFGGAAALDVPGTDEMTLDLPKIPRIFEAHRANLAAARATGLDWSMLCPGPMIDSPNGAPTTGLRLSAEEWPTARPPMTRALPRLFTSLAFKQAIPSMTIYYEDAARTILDDLAKGGPFSRKRVGIALPVGQSRVKDYRPA